MNQWKPIDTADTDGPICDVILVFGKLVTHVPEKLRRDGKVARKAHIFEFDNGEPGVFTASYMPAYGEFFPPGYDYLEPVGDDAIWVDATHWMPLPSPPSK